MRLSIATPKAIRYACTQFHYAKSVPSVQYGFNVFNDSDEWCGVICYGNGATVNIGKPFGMCQGEILELVRVALNGKQGHGKTSEAVAASLRKLHELCPLVRMIVSYADCDQDHTGIIYQATNWIYLGRCNEGQRSAFIIRGKKTHPRTIGSMGGVQSIEWVRSHIDENAEVFYTKGKEKYIYCFDKRLRKQWQKQAKPYPKKIERKAVETDGERTESAIM